MKMYDVICPVCGEVNHNRFLAETDGWYECDKCGSILQDEGYCKNERQKIWEQKFRKVSGTNAAVCGR